MGISRLNVIAVEKKEEDSAPRRPERTNREEVQATFERMWHRSPQQFSPLRNCKEKERLQRTMELISASISLPGKAVADLGCGSGELSCLLANAGAVVDALDIAKNALKALEEKHLNGITPIHGLLPSTPLKDDFYDLALCSEVIAYLPERHHRLLFSELARLIKDEGFALCSTAIDIHSEDVLQKFISLAETELEIVDYRLSYHRLYIILKDFFSAPSLKTGLFFKILATFSNPLAAWIRTSRPLLLSLEKVCRFIWSDTGISHIMIIGKRRPFLIEPLKEEQRPLERKQKKLVWE